VELGKFTPVLELANPVDGKGRPADDDFDALLMELEELEDKVVRNPRRKVEVGRLGKVVALVQDRLKKVIDEKLILARGDAGATQEMANWLQSVTARVDNKYRTLYQATLDIVKGEAGAEDALCRIRARFNEVDARSIEPVQCTRDQVELFCQAARVRKRADAFMKRYEARKGGQLKPHAPLKRNARVAEKIMLRPGHSERNAERIFDVVRNMYEASTLREVADVVDDICACDAIEVVRIKDRFHEPSPGGWSDCMINYVLRDDPHRHICELQIAHSQLIVQRREMKAHAVYGHTRNAPELLEKLQG